MRVFVDSDSAIARAWTERVFETYRDSSDPVAVAGRAGDGARSAGTPPDGSGD